LYKSSTNSALAAQLIKQFDRAPFLGIEVLALAGTLMRRGDYDLKSNHANNSYWTLEICGSERFSMAISADLGTSLEKFVTKLVATGRYGSKSEVLREGVRLIQERETRLAALDASIARGLADADAGRVTPVAKAFDRVEATLRAKAGTKRP
jgi:antitoxin ParD1/3/4